MFKEVSELWLHLVILFFLLYKPVSVLCHIKDDDWWWFMIGKNNIVPLKGTQSNVWLKLVLIILALYQNYSTLSVKLIWVGHNTVLTDGFLNELILASTVCKKNLDRRNTYRWRLCLEFEATRKDIAI